MAMKVTDGVSPREIEWLIIDTYTQVTDIATNSSSHLDKLSLPGPATFCIQFLRFQVFFILAYPSTP